MTIIVSKSDQNKATINNNAPFVNFVVLSSVIFAQWHKKKNVYIKKNNGHYYVRATMYFFKIKNRTFFCDFLLRLGTAPCTISIRLDYLILNYIVVDVVSCAYHRLASQKNIEQ